MVIHRLLQKFVQGPLLCVVLSCLLALSFVGTCVTIPLQTAHADSAALTVGHKIEYASWDTNAFSVNGFEAYCGAPSSSTPAEGTYELEPLTNTMVAAGLWYGYGGPGFDANLWPQNCPVSSGADAYRVMTHVALAYLASADPNFAYNDCDQNFKEWCNGALFGAGSICERIRNFGFTINGASDNATTLPRGFSAYSMYTGADTQIVYAMDYHPFGDFSLEKGSARPGISDSNSSYTLAGARYGIFSDAACARRVSTITTDAAGRGSSGELQVGTYYIKEETAPAGYALSTTVTTVRVNAGSNGVVRVQDEPQSNPVEVLLRKVDAETNTGAPLGGAALAGAEYRVRFYAGQYPSASAATASGTLRRTWVLRTNDRGELLLNDDAKVGGDAFFRDAQNRIVLPLGTVTIEETAAPRGYLRADGIMLATVTASGTSASVNTYTAPTHPEQVIRGDLSFVKARETDQHRLSGIPFRLTSNTTGESHILVTDENGEAKTTNAWNAHTTRTNANDAAVRADGTVDEARLDAEAGIWFGGSTPRNDLGALPFDTYTLTELQVNANEGLELVNLPSLTIKRNGYEVDWGTIDDQPIPVPSLRTHASSALSGAKTLEAIEEVIVRDEVHYSGVEAGREYRVTGHLVDRASAATLVDEADEPVSNSVTFIAEGTEGDVELAFTFDARDHASADIVVLEELTDVEADKTIAAESDLDDSEQTVRIADVEPPEEPEPEPVEEPEPEPEPEPAEEPEEPAKKAPETEPILEEPIPLAPAPTVEPVPVIAEEPALVFLVQTGDALFPLMVGGAAVAIVAGFAIMRTSRGRQRKRLRSRLRTGL